MYGAGLAALTANGGKKRLIHWLAPTSTADDNLWTIYLYEMDRCTKFGNEVKKSLQRRPKVHFARNLGICTELKPLNHWLPADPSCSDCNNRCGCKL